MMATCGSNAETAIIMLGFFALIAWLLWLAAR
jgi:hypothetical protein